MKQPGAAHIWGVFGSSGTGKDAWTKQQLRRLAPPRLVVWDQMDEYGDFAQLVGTPAELLEGVGAARFALRYVPTAAERAEPKLLRAAFERVCRIVWAAERCTFVVTELSRVTSPSHAPWAWSEMTTAGRHRRIHVIGISQFPAQVDKSLLGNATLLHCGYLANVRHRQAVAVEMDADPDQLRQLDDLEYLEWTRGAREATRGKVQFAATPSPPTRSGSGSRRPRR